MLAGPKSGKMHEYPGVDRAGWFTVEGARGKLKPAQAQLLDSLSSALSSGLSSPLSSDKSLV